MGTFPIVQAQLVDYLNSDNEGGIYLPNLVECYRWPDASPTFHRKNTAIVKLLVMYGFFHTLEQFTHSFSLACSILLYYISENARGFPSIPFSMVQTTGQ